MLIEESKIRRDFFHYLSRFAQVERNDDSGKPRCKLTFRTKGHILDSLSTVQFAPSFFDQTNEIETTFVQTYLCDVRMIQILGITAVPESPDFVLHLSKAQRKAYNLASQLQNQSNFAAAVESRREAFCQQVLEDILPYEDRPQPLSDFLNLEPMQMQNIEWPMQDTAMQSDEEAWLKPIMHSMDEAYIPSCHIVLYNGTTELNSYKDIAFFLFETGGMEFLYDYTGLPELTMKPGWFFSEYLQAHCYWGEKDCRVWVFFGDPRDPRVPKESNGKQPTAVPLQDLQRLYSRHTASWQHLESAPSWRTKPIPSQSEDLLRSWRASLITSLESSNPK